jgi:hypothetical protein
VSQHLITETYCADYHHSNIIACLKALESLGDSHSPPVHPEMGIHTKNMWGWWSQHHYTGGCIMLGARGMNDRQWASMRASCDCWAAMPAGMRLAMRADMLVMGTSHTHMPCAMFTHVEVVLSDICEVMHVWTWRGCCAAGGLAQKGCLSSCPIIFLPVWCTRSWTCMRNYSSVPERAILTGGQGTAAAMCQSVKARHHQLPKIFSLLGPSTAVHMSDTASIASSRRGYTLSDKALSARKMNGQCKCWFHDLEMITRDSL